MGSGREIGRAESPSGRRPAVRTTPALQKSRRLSVGLGAGLIALFLFLVGREPAKLLAGLFEVLFKGGGLGLGSASRPFRCPSRR